MQKKTAAAGGTQGSLNQREKEKEELAGQILEYVRDRLVVFMPFFNRALLMMEPVFEKNENRVPGKPGGTDAASPCSMATDGIGIHADPDEVIRIFRGDPARLPRIYLHMIFHCLLEHPFHYDQLDTEAWDFAADCAAEKMVLDNAREEAGLPGDIHRMELLDELERETGGLNAERIYHSLVRDEKMRREWLQTASLFREDDHRLWLTRTGDPIGGEFIDRAGAEDMDETVKQWTKMRQGAKIDMQTWQKSYGEEAGTRALVYRDISPDERDYSEFLRKFARETEVLRLNPDEFDYIYYTYGLTLYGNMPLIEPLEYRDAPLITDFVIAIDTSGSCQGETVKNFLRKTCSLLTNQKIFAERMNLLILQCDCEIQDETWLRNADDMERYIREIRISGAGGTDFRPVFRRVEELTASGEMRNPGGLLYFTDGLGRFPDQKPEYPAAFILVGKEPDTPHFPPWAETYVLL